MAEDMKTDTLWKRKINFTPEEQLKTIVKNVGIQWFEVKGATSGDNSDNGREGQFR